MLKLLQDGYSMLFYLFVAIIVFGSSNSKEIEEDYTPVGISASAPVSNNHIEDIRTESNNEWGSIADPSY